MQKEVYEFVSKEMNDPILQWKKCRVSWKVFPIFQSEHVFLKNISPTFAWKTFLVPYPTLCPELRHMRRMCFRNDRSLYKRNCDATGKWVISMFHPQAPFVVYDKEYRWGDTWSAFDYGVDFDERRGFFDQFGQLFHNVPLPSLLNSNSELSDYVNQTDSMKSCYLMYSCCRDEHCYFGNRAFDCSYCLDCSVAYNCQHCYQCIDIHDCYQCFWGEGLLACRDSYFLFDCHDCHHCFGCWNLRAASFCVFNQQYSETEYFQKISQRIGDLGSRSKSGQVIALCHKKIREHAAYHATRQTLSENSFGGFLFASKNIFACYEWGDLEDCHYGLMLHNAKNVMDNNNSTWSQRQYEVSTGGLWWYNDLFCLDVWPGVTDSYYSAFCASSDHLFGCVGLKNASYCVLNKQYNKLDRERLVGDIIEHMMSSAQSQKISERWEFFDPSMSPFGINESAAYEYFPVEKTQALARWFPWRDRDLSHVAIQILLADHIDDIAINKAGTVLTCEVSGRWFSLTPQELSFYKQHRLSVPSKHPDIRHLERFHQRPARDLHLRKCDKTGEKMICVYGNEDKRKILSDEAYKQEVYG